MPDHGQEREAQRDLMSARSRDDLERELLDLRAALTVREEAPTSRERKLQDALADALLWLERIPPPEEEIRALGRGLWDETLENARALVAAGEDTERPDDVKVARETLAIIEALGRDALETPQELALRARSAMRMRDTEQEPER